MNIFEDYLEIVDYQAYNILSTYEHLFNNLGICISKYEDEFGYWDVPDNLQENLKKILLYGAQEEGIIPEEVDVENCFNVSEDFAIYSNTENYKQIIKDFEDWCEIELNVLDE